MLACVGLQHFENLLVEELLLDVQGLKAQRAELISREEGLLHPTDRNGLQCSSGTDTTRRATRLADRALDPVQLISERTHRLLNVEELLRGTQVRGVGKVRAGHRVRDAARGVNLEGRSDSRHSAIKQGGNHGTTASLKMVEVRKWSTQRSQSVSQ